jgi:hypothetical protein
VPVDPLTPEFRRLLKEAHPGLRDVDIDRLEELTARRVLIPPEERSDELAYERSDHVRAIDHQISELMRERMPHFDRVAREYAAMRRAEQSVPEVPKVVIRPKR